MVRLALSRREPLSIRLQVGEQLRHQIEDGSLAPGSRLPTVRELAATLHINYNTVRGVYTELEREGFVVSEQGRGTFVSGKPPRKATAALHVMRDLVDDALSRATAAGLSPNAFARMTYTRAKLFRRGRRPRLLFVECNTSELNDFAGQIEQATGITPAKVTVAALRKKRRAFLDRFDVVTTTFPHMPEVRKIAGPKRDLIGVMLEPDYRTVVAEIAEMPMQSSVGLVCSSEGGATAMLRAVQAAGLSERTYLISGATSSRKLAQVFANSDRVYVSRRYIDEHGHRVVDGDHVREYRIHVTPASLRFLRQRLSAE